MSRRKYPFKQIFLNIGERIKKIRGSLTQTEFGKIFGVNQNTVSRWESGSISDEETLKRIAEYGGVSIDWLLRGDQPPELREFAPETYDTRPAILDTDRLARALVLIRQYLKKARLQFSESQEAALVSYIYEYLEAEHADPGEVVIRRLADLIPRQKA